MHTPRLTRRQFFKASALGAGALALPALGLASVAAAPSREAQAAAEQPDGPAIPQPTFNPIASNTTFGPLTDISMGWDGTLWGIDAQGAPHIYDPINAAWQQHGDGIDAVATGLNDAGALTLYVFSGSAVVAINPTTLQASPPTPIAALWPSLPDSFKLGVAGAVGNNAGKGLILFNGGRYVSTDGSVPVTKVTDLASWPQTANWKDGVMDGVMQLGSGGEGTFMRGNEVVPFTFLNKTAGAPRAFSDYMSALGVSLPATWLSSGVDAMLFANPTTVFAFKGTAVFALGSDGSGAVGYIGNAFGNWPSTWHPVLRHAPNGRDGNLWSVLPTAKGSAIVQHNGDAWTQLPNQADHVGVGQDNAVMIASAGALFNFTGAFDGTGFTPVSPASNLIQVSLGNANAVHARDTNGNVYSFNPTTGALTPNTAVGAVAHIAATSDGSLWHARANDPNMHRQLVGSGAAPEAIPVKQNLITAVIKVAGTGFGAAHCLATDGQGNTQAYRYDSPYVFKTAAQYNVFDQTAPAVEQGAGLLFVTNNVLVSTAPFTTNTQIVAIDAHTGAEVARTPQSPANQDLGQPVFDPVFNLVYVGSAPKLDTDNTTPGHLLALDARTLEVKWEYFTQAGIDATPALDGARLYVGDRTSKLYAFDTSAAFANPSAVQPIWAFSLSSIEPADADTWRIATPTFVRGSDGKDYVCAPFWRCMARDSAWWTDGVALFLNASDGAFVPNAFLALNDEYGVSGVLNLENLLTAPMRAGGNNLRDGASRRSRHGAHARGGEQHGRSGEAVAGRDAVLQPLQRRV
jgi:hypothetical protein